MIRAVAVALALILGACGEKPGEAPKEAAPAAPSLAKALKTIAFTCDKDLPVTAIYGTDTKGQPDLALIIRGDDFRLTPSPVAGRYTTQYGLTPGMGLALVEQGEEVLLQQAPFQQIDDPKVAQTIRTCRVKAEPAAVGK
ncbi:MAG: hypothetical protein ACRC1J_06305 [Sandaracinobacteroides sp.]